MWPGIRSLSDGASHYVRVEGPVHCILHAPKFIIRVDGRELTEDWQRFGKCMQTLGIARTYFSFLGCICLYLEWPEDAALLARQVPLKLHATNDCYNQVVFDSAYHGAFSGNGKGGQP
jgi:hypothetical protein